MKKALTTLIFALACANSFAADDDQQPSEASMMHAHCSAGMKAMQKQIATSQQPNDPRFFCFHDGKAYSEGAVVNNKTCVQPVITGNDSDRKPLVWHANPKKQAM